MGAEVKISMSPSDFETLKALLWYQSGKGTKEQVKTVLLSLGYRAEALESSGFDEILKMHADRIRGLLG